MVLVEGKLSVVNRTGSDQLESFATDDGTLSQNNLGRQEPGSNPTYKFYKTRCLFAIRSQTSSPTPYPQLVEHVEEKAWWRKNPGFHGLHEEVGI